MEFTCWQDIVIAVVHFLFIPALIPSLRSKREKPHRQTCLRYGVLLGIMTGTLASLGLWLGAFGEFIVTVLWFALLFQKRKKR